MRPLLAAIISHQQSKKKKKKREEDEGKEGRKTKRKFEFPSSLKNLAIDCSSCSQPNCPFHYYNTDISSILNTINVTFPPSLTHLTIGAQFKLPLPPSISRSSITQLKLGTLHQPVPSFPPSLSHLTINKDSAHLITEYYNKIEENFSITFILKSPKKQ